MEDVAGLTFLSVLQENILLIIFQVCIIAAAYFLKRQPNAPAALQPLIYGFCFLIISKFFFLIRVVNDNILFTVFEISSFSLVMGMFITSALLLRGIKAVNMSFACILSLLLFGFMSYSVFFTGAAYLKYIVFYLSLCIGFGSLSCGFFPKGENKSDYGFYMASLTLLALAILNLAMISAWFRTTFGTTALMLLYFMLAFSFILVGANLLENKISDLENEVSNERKKLLLLVQSSPFPIIISRLRDEKILLINSKAESLLGIRMKNLPSCKLSHFFECPNLKGKLLARLERTKDVEDFDIRLSTDKVPPLYAGMWFSLSSHIIDFEYEIALYSVLQDITKRKQKEQELFNEASRDSLTSCYTRRFFEDLARKEISRSIHTGSQFCFMMIDADHFKNVNDTYGHDIGDKVLRALADTCHRVLRGSDIVGRFGGEEFLIMLTDITPQNADIIANRLREAISKLIIKSNKDEDITFTVSMGLATSDYSTDFHSLVTAADSALYQAKNTGRNKVVCFSKEMA